MSAAPQVDPAALAPMDVPGRLDRLRAVGLDHEALADLVDATAFFAWANRLMLTLGEPAWPSQG